MTRREVLLATRFGERIAEEEGSEFNAYFVETDPWRRIYGGEVDVVYGVKGAGKSAIYSLLLSRSEALLQRGIVVVAAENPRGVPIFRDLTAEPPPGENEFRGIWKLYFLSLIAQQLRALFRVYLDLLQHRHLSLKIFLRSDIWQRILAPGFREASHVTRHLTISWSHPALLNLVVRRALHNDALRAFYQVHEAEVLADVQKQTKLFYRIFPDQVESGPKRPKTFDWMLSRTRDAFDWNVSRDAAVEIADKLCDVGFFEKQGSREDLSFRVPFLYRPALKMVQGSAE